MRSWLTSMRVYLDPRMLALFLLGFSSGLPRLLVYSTLTFWLLEEGLDIKSVGLFAATALPYNFKFLWAPLLDRLQVPVFGKLLGLRRGWIFVLQLALMGAIGALAMCDPGQDAFWCAMAALGVAAISASQDVVIDAYRVERLDDDEQGAGAAAAVFGYRVGMLAASAGALYIAEWSGDWQLTYLVMAGLVTVGLATTLMSAEPDKDEPQECPASTLAHLKEGVVGPLRDFASRKGWAAIAAFILLYKLGDALAGTMTNPLLVDLEFSKVEIANIAKTYGLAASIAGVFLGGLVVRRLGIVGALWVGGVLQMASNLMFSLQADAGHDMQLLTATIGVENLSGGLGTAAFVAYLSALCKREYTATQYALLTALSSGLRTLTSSGAGYAVAWMGWTTYFVATTAAALPGLALLYWLSRKKMTGLRPGR
ncbi:AmpG family muropeptide MFS transporter [Persicimonas caeni]|nr:AmpG family muropeptide MFS transporter [Persicimonas caeni]